MKTRRWVLVIALFFGFTLLVLYHGWNFFKVNDRLLHIAEKQLKQTLGDSLSIKKLELAIGAIHLKDVDLSLREGYYRLHVDDIRFGFNFFNFVKYGFRIKRIPQDIIFIRPVFTIKPVAEDSIQSSSLDSTLKQIDTNLYLRKLENLQTINRITISKGKISFVDSAETPVLLANDINGWLSTSNVEKTTIRLVGKIFNSTNFNLGLSGYANLKLGRLDTLVARVNNYQWRKEDSFFLPDYYKIEKGLINGLIVLREKPIGRRGFEIGGNLEIQDAKISLPQQNLTFDKINVETEVREWNLYVKQANALLNGSPIEISGMVKNILNPELNLTISSTEFDTGNLFASLLPNWKVRISGKANLKIKAAGSLISPVLQSQIFSRKTLINDNLLTDLKIKIEYRDSVFTIKRLALKFDDLTWSGKGNFNLSVAEKTVQYEANAHGFLPEHILPVKIGSITKSWVNASFSGNGKFTDFTTKISLLMKIKSDTIAAFRGFVDFADQSLELHLNDAKRKCNIRGAYDFSDRENGLFLHASGLNNIVQQFEEYKKLLHFFHFRKSELTVRKNKTNWLFSANLVWNNNPELSREASIWAVIAKDNNRTTIDGDYKIFTDNKYFPGEFSARINPRTIEIKKIALENLLFGELKIEKTGDQELSGQFIFPNTQAADLARILFRRTRGVEKGALYGSVGFSGTLKNPTISGKLDFNEIFLHGIGAYHGNVQFSLVDKLYLLNQFELSREDKRLFTATGSYNLKNKSLNFSLNGDGVDVNSTLRAFFEKENLLTGTANLDVSLKGTTTNPCFCGTIEVANGRFTRFYFDKMVFSLVDQQTFAEMDSLGIFDNSYPALRIGNFSFIRIGEFQLQGKGLIPLKREKPIDLEFEGKGNLLSILPEFTPFFKETAGDGSWYAHLRGAPGNISLADLEVELHDGYLRLGNVAPEIKNIALNLKMEPDGFIHVSNLSGKIRRREFKFSNQRLPKNPINEKFRPFEIPILNLNLGVFTIETSNKGIPLHIPGLMEKGDFGQFILLGKNNNEQFYVAGPAWRPYVRGKLILQNMNFTFPFIPEGKGKKETDNPVVRVLRSIDWDVLALTGKDLHYQRQIPSGLDNVYLDLIIDAGVGGLNFKGRIADNTFGVTGLLESSRGNVEYLNLNFQVTRAGAEFDMEPSGDGSVEFDKTSLLPIVYGEARTTVIDSTGFPYYIYLTLLTKDSETGQTRKRGRLGEMVFQLSSENQRLGGTEGEILASLGYSTDKIKEMATDLIGISADNLLFRPLFRPFERELERKLGLDMVRFSSRFTRNLIERNVNDEHNFQLNSKLFLLRSTKLMIGKYLLNQLLFTYSGQIEAGLDYRYQHEGLGMSHRFGLEYRISPSLLLEMEYDYNSLLLYRREDKRILLRHSFPF